MRPEEIQRRLGLRFNSPSLLVEALTHPSFLNENPGSPLASYQRLEFLGDAILGSVVALELFQRCPDLSEGELTRLRSHLVQGSSLARVAARLDLGSCLNLGRGEEAGGGRHRESNLAAAFEALVGAVFLDQGADAARAFILEFLSEDMEEAQKGGPPTDPKSQLQEMVQAGGGEPPQYRVVSLKGPDHSKTFAVEVLVDSRVLGVGSGKRKLNAEREAASKAIEALRSGAGSQK